MTDLRLDDESRKAGVQHGGAKDLQHEFTVEGKRINRAVSWLGREEVAGPIMLAEIVACIIIMAVGLVR